MRILTQWEFDPGICIPLAIAGVLNWRGSRAAVGLASWEKICFWTGFAVLTLALVSPIHAVGEELFSAHMVQHEVLMLIASPLLVLSRPLVPMLWGMPFEVRRTVGRWSKSSPVQMVWRWISRPAAAWVIHGGAIWVWHVPRAFEATLASDWAHAAQHASFFGSALLFWWALFDSRRARHYGSAVLYLFTTAVHTSILGALLTFARTPWYSAYQATAPGWGFTPLEDQQAGGLIMWVPGGLVYLGAALYLFSAWLRGSDGVTGGQHYAA